MIIKFNRWLSAPLKKTEFDINNYFNDLIFSESKKSRSIIELGGVSRPVLKKSTNYRYVGVDIDENFEHDNYYDQFYCQSVENEFPEKGDLIFSKFLMEHVLDVELSYERQIKSLNTGGKIIHLYPLGYHPFSILNKIIGNKLANKIIPIIRKGSEEVTGYPAYYTLGNAFLLERFLKSREDLQVDFRYHYGAVDYFSFFFPLAVLITCFNLISKNLGLKLFASSVIVTINKIR